MDHRARQQPRRVRFAFSPSLRDLSLVIPHVQGKSMGTGHNRKEARTRLVK